MGRIKGYKHSEATREKMKNASFGRVAAGVIRSCDIAVGTYIRKSLPDLYNKILKFLGIE